MTNEEAIDTLDHVLDAYEVGDIDPAGSVDRLRRVRAYLAIVDRRSMLPVMEAL